VVETLIKNRALHIDALRGLAALYVVFGHALNWYHLNISPDVGIPFEWLKQFTSALAGVFLFFMISGYVIPSSFQGEGYEGARRFVIRRFFRLYPLFWVSMLPSVVHYIRGVEHAYSLKTILCNLTMVPGLFDQGFVVAVYWTLVQELVFYLFCLGLHWVKWVEESKKLAIGSLSFGIGYWVFKGGAWLGLWQQAETFFQKTVLISLSLMFWGALWRNFQEKKCSGVWERVALAFIPLQAIVLVGCRPFYDRAEVKANFPVSFASSLAVGVGIFILGTTWMQMKNRVLVWCGTVSYSLYLLHMFVIMQIARVFSWGGWGMPSLGMFILSALIGSCILAAAGFYLVERPTMALGRSKSQRAFIPLVTQK
jgi:peptidoglycan/LPS O-acetylase OafA/YrhL